MKILRADVLGFCMGVRRAVDTVQKTLTEKAGYTIYTYGPLIHNPLVLDRLKTQGVSVLEESQISFLNNKCVAVIRAHGVPPKIQQRIADTGCLVVDATCPRVKVSQKRAYEYSQQEYTVLLTGDSNHGEVVGIAGYAGKEFYLLQNVKDAYDFVDTHTPLPEKVILLSQTTFSMTEFKKIEDYLTKKMPQLKVFQTICAATKERQESLERLCKKVDGIIVIGGKNSANTQRLYHIASSLCQFVAHIETPEEIPEQFYGL
ncbi:MAG: 4-hydroxy-3-methylbut-2-enyl diphosphate reductase, partial [Treponema sp.]|nr:4-hydroxy-3-methylbut-2-enyl diphosphate reductase [Treponema sp.]